MLSQLFRQLFSSFGIFFRTIRAFFTRRLSRVTVYARRLTNVSQYAGRIANTSFKGLSKAMKKPTKREDYIETKRMFISKSFLVAAAIAVVGIVLLLYFVVWPFLLSHFFVAKFYQEDPDLETWSGRVIVYYDKEKTMPLYEGKLEEGLLQGKGTEYDRAGLVTYKGDFVDSVYCGDGCSYVDGLLLYEGDFENGLYNGKGDLYNGEALCYSGEFADGLFEGNGTYFYPSGERHYVGTFSAGQLEGEGVEYREDGSMLYKGGFSADLYEGDGVYYYAEDNFVKAAFSAGLTGGEIQWYQEGRLWYDGGADNLTPDGFGTIYAASGKPIYAGEMDRGTIDGAWLLGLSADEVRESFGEARVTEKVKNRGFQIVNQTLGLTVLCNYQEEGGEAQVFKVFLSPEGVDSTLLPWQNSNELTQWAATGREETPKVVGILGEAVGPSGHLSGNWNQSKYVYETYFCIMLWKNEHGTPVQLTWGNRTNIPDTGMGSPGETVSAAQERLDGLMEELDEVMDGAPSKESAAAVSALIEEAGGAEDAGALVDALADCYTYTGMVAALESGQTILQEQLADANAALSRGTGSQEAVDDLQEALDELGRTLAQYETGAKQAEITAKYYCGTQPDTANLQSALVAFDPTKLKAATLCDAAVQYAQEVAAGRYEVNTGELTLKVKTGLLDLNMAYENYTAARESVEKTAAGVEAQTAAYAQGTVEKSALYEAQLAQNTAVSSLYGALSNFTHQAVALNTLTGGQISKEENWLADAFADVFAAEIEKGKQEAEAESPEESGEETGEESQQEADAVPTESGVRLG